jgi:hypothetical protein
MESSVLARFNTKVIINVDTGCWEWNGGKHAYGYGLLWCDGTMKRAHRLAYLHWKGPIAEGLLVRHKCRGLCVNPEHLELGTLTENARDKVRDETNTRGEKHGRSKLTDDQVRDIRSRVDVVGRELAREFGVSETVISFVLNRRSWKHL